MLEAFAMSDKGCVRSNNEDYCLIEPERGLYVLADGMGGAKAGERASRLAVDTVAEIVHAAPQLDSQVLLTAVEEANRRVLAAAHERSGTGRHGHHAGGGPRSGGRLFHRQRGRQPRVCAGRRRPARDHRRPDLGQRSWPAARSGRREPAQPPHAPRAHHGHRRQRAAYRELLLRAAENGALVLLCSDGLHGVLESPATWSKSCRRARAGCWRKAAAN